MKTTFFDENCLVGLRAAFRRPESAVGDSASVLEPGDPGPVADPASGGFPASIPRPSKNHAKS
jgi:hypothetical protein